jgi:TPP-dependent pyruvate/acetoin dehydrogenase alpha subunit
VQKLPLVVVLEANHYAYSTPTTSQVPDGDLVRRARGFGCTVAYLDGNDVLACYEGARDARDRAVAGGGPTVIIAETYRREGHAEHDNQKYVDPAEIDSWATGNDPVDRYVAFLEGGAHAEPSQLEAIRNRVDEELDAARGQAVGEPFPDAATVTHGVFADDTRPQPPVDTWFAGGSKLRGSG